MRLNIVNIAIDMKATFSEDSLFKINILIGDSV